MGPLFEVVHVCRVSIGGHTKNELNKLNEERVVL